MQKSYNACSRFFRVEATSNSRKPGEKTTIYFPLVPKGNYVGDRGLENLLKNIENFCSCEKVMFFRTFSQNR